jgi:hypothetical protein
VWQVPPDTLCISSTCDTEFLNTLKQERVCVCVCVCIYIYTYIHTICNGRALLSTHCMCEHDLEV